MTDPTTTPPLAPGQIEIWKKIVDVQQHFNDLELRVRNFALIVTGAFLGLGGYALKDGGTIIAFGWEVPVATLVIWAATVPLLAFYFMDRLWYHRLLDGSVQAGIKAEEALQALGYKVDLGTQISRKSPFKLWFIGKPIHSRTKMDLFYLMLGLTLIAVGLGLALGISPHSLPTAKQAETQYTSANAVTQNKPHTTLTPTSPVSPTYNSINAAETAQSHRRPIVAD